MGEVDVVIGFETFGGDFHHLSGFVFLTVTTVGNDGKLVFDKVSSISIEFIYQLKVFPGEEFHLRCSFTFICSTE